VKTRSRELYVDQGTDDLVDWNSLKGNRSRLLYTALPNLAVADH
jgi:hypothetical protein